MFPNLYERLAKPEPFKDRPFRAYSLAFKGRENLEYGDKILLPQSAFHQLARLRISYPMMFRIRNPVTGSSTHVGVMEFTAEEGKVYMPHWIMQHIFLENGQLVEITNVSLPKGTFVQFRPHETAFTQLSNPRVVLEKSMRSYSCLTKGGQIVIDYGVGDLRRQFTLDVVDTKPADAISVIETDLNVDFAPPKDAPPESARPIPGSRDMPMVIDSDEEEDEPRLPGSPPSASNVPLSSSPSSSQSLPKGKSANPRLSYFDRLGPGHRLRGPSSASAASSTAAVASSAAQPDPPSSSSPPASSAIAQGDSNKVSAAGRRVVEGERFTFIYEGERLIRRIPKRDGFLQSQHRKSSSEEAKQNSKPDWMSTPGHRLR